MFKRIIFFEKQIEEKKNLKKLNSLKKIWKKNLKNKFWKEENIKKLVCKKIYKNRF